jgi:hypothetical protein
VLTEELLLYPLCGKFLIIYNRVSQAVVHPLVFRLDAKATMFWFQTEVGFVLMARDPPGISRQLCVEYGDSVSRIMLSEPGN